MIDPYLQNLLQLADELGRRRLDGRLIDALPGSEGLDETAAYHIQDLLHTRLSSAGQGIVAGYKIGCTTPVMQRYLNIDHPCAGAVMSATVVRGSGEFAALPQGRLGVECEIAVTLAQALGPTTAPHDPQSVRNAIASCHAAIEIVADRYADYSQLSAPFLIADDFFNAGCVLGEAQTAWQELDLAAVRGQLWVNDELRGSGHGADILGHPLAALAWLANRYAELDRTLPAGGFVLLGSVVQTQWLDAGSRVRVALEGLGEAAAVITAA